MMRKREAKIIFQKAPYQLGNPNDLIKGVKEETETPFTVVTLSFRGKLQLLITRKSENLVETFFDELGNVLKYTEDYDRNLVQDPIHNLGLSKTSLDMVCWLKSVDSCAFVQNLKAEKDK